MSEGETISETGRDAGEPGAGEGERLVLNRLDLSLGNPVADLALDEALLVEAEASSERWETLRMWSFATPVVVIGRGSKRATEVDLEHCERVGVPVLRRCSGGAAIVGGPGCWMYSVVLDLRARPELRKVDEAHAWVMSRLVAAIARQLPEVRWQGTCDLTLGDRKFSGNSLRVARDHLLYHGTILHDADLPSIERCLRTPPRQPDYRQGRGHADFVTNVPIDPARLAEDVAERFGATEPRSAWPRAETERLIGQRYGQAAWHARH